MLVRDQIERKKNKTPIFTLSDHLAYPNTYNELWMSMQGCSEKIYGLMEHQCNVFFPSCLEKTSKESAVL